MSDYKMFQQQWVFEAVCASDNDPQVSAAVRKYMRGNSNGAAQKSSLSELANDIEFGEEDGDDILHVKIMYDYIKSVAPDLDEDQEFLIYNWW